MVKQLHFTVIWNHYFEKVKQPLLKLVVITEYEKVNWLQNNKSHYEEVIVVITWVRGGAEDKCNNAEDECNSNDNLRVQWDLIGLYPIVFDVRHIMQ